METRQETQQCSERQQTVRSFLDTDHYKLTMGQFAFKRYADVPVKYAFKNRTKGINLAEVIDESDLRQELDKIQDLRPTKEELDFLAGLQNNGRPLFNNQYLDFLRNIQLSDYDLSFANREMVLEFKGPWAKAIYWETPALAAINELYYRALLDRMSTEEADALCNEGNKRLEDKIRKLEENPDVRFMEFGTRRRFSSNWQEQVVNRLRKQAPNQMVGTSNVYLAMKYGIEPRGTMAHETFMIMSGIMHQNDETIRASHNQVLQEWWEEYGESLSVALTDTYGTDFFFQDLTEQQARDWKGLRQDSGNPEAFARQQIEFYKSKGINPKTKLFVPSDGLDIKKITRLQRKFGREINSVAGWGTNLTNDLGLKPLSLVIKAVESNGHGTVKLSDNPAKAMGKPEDIKRFMRIFDYNPDKYQKEECVY